MAKLIDLCFAWKWEYDADLMQLLKEACANAHRSLAAEDKMTMHHALINAGVQTPHTIFLPSFVVQPEIHPIDLGALKGKFIIKPAHGAGGQGVKVEADSWDTVLEARREFPDEIYLLQVNVVPGVLNNRPSWFRVL